MAYIFFLSIFVSEHMFHPVNNVALILFKLKFVRVLVGSSIFCRLSRVEFIIFSSTVRSWEYLTSEAKVVGKI